MKPLGHLSPKVCKPQSFEEAEEPPAGKSGKRTVPPGWWWENQWVGRREQSFLFTFACVLFKGWLTQTYPHYLDFRTFGVLWVSKDLRPRGGPGWKATKSQPTLGT